MANIVNNYSSTMVTIFQDVIRTYERNIDIIKECEDTLNDINHEIEFSDSKDLYRGYLMYKDIKELRQKRRQAKQENELLKEEAQQRRTYVPRKRTDLTIADRTCETKPSFEQMLADFNKNKASMKSGKLRK